MDRIPSGLSAANVVAVLSPLGQFRAQNGILSPVGFEYSGLSRVVLQSPCNGAGGVARCLCTAAARFSLSGSMATASTQLTRATVAVLLFIVCLTDARKLHSSGGQQAKARQGLILQGSGPPWFLPIPRPP